MNWTIEKAIDVIENEGGGRVWSMVETRDLLFKRVELLHPAGDLQGVFYTITWGSNGLQIVNAAEMIAIAADILRSWWGEDSNG